MNTNILYEHMYKRKSSRIYNQNPLPQKQLQDILNFVNELKPLYQEIHIDLEFTDRVRNILPIKAPHYCLIYSEPKPGYLLNAGFMLQQLDLYLSAQGLGSCWLGVAKPVERKTTELEFVIALAFGKTDHSPYRELTKFKRKPLEQIATGQDGRVECARLAPSARNMQNWFFCCSDGKIHVYMKNNSLLKRFFQRMNHIDIGIAICHLYLATAEQRKAFHFYQENHLQEIKGYTYMGTVL